jgi:hypothetical protein
MLGYTPDGEALSAEGQRTGGLWKHSRAREARRILGEEIWSRYFTFTFVRSPWDVVVSEFHWWRTTQFENEHGTARAIREMTDLSEYLHSPWFQRRPAFDFVADEDGQIIVDFVGRYESLQRDFDTVMRTLGLPSRVLPVRNTTEHDHYSRYYAPDTRDLVADAYRADLTAFGYQFQG